MRCVSYHQNVFDLLDVELPVARDVVERLDGWERERLVSLPRALREWYSFSGAVPLLDGSHFSVGQGHLWSDFSPANVVWPLERVLGRVEQALLRTSLIPVECLTVATNGRTSRNWLVSIDEKSDPMVWEDGPRNPARWSLVGRFSDFVFEWIAGEYPKSGIPLSARSGYNGPVGPWSVRPKKYLEGLWLRAPREPALLPPHIDQLIDTLQEDGREQRADGPTTYRFRLGSAWLKVTTDHWQQPDGHSAWWLHADSPDELEELARRVLRIADPGLRGFTEIAAHVLALAGEE